MKKIIVLISMFFFLSGCTNINDLNVKDIIDLTIDREISMANQFRSGYKYYLPRGLKIIDKKDFNEVAKGEDYNYYIYVDVISYYNKVVEKYDVNRDVYLSYEILKDGKFGYVEVKYVKKNKYLLEIMYNYAKIEVIVEKSDINVAVSNAIEVLSTIEYNDNIIKNLIDDNVLLFSEMEFNIFESKKDVTSPYLESLDENMWENEEVVDPDLIN